MPRLRRAVHLDCGRAGVLSESRPPQSADALPELPFRTEVGAGGGGGGGGYSTRSSYGGESGYGVQWRRYSGGGGGGYSDRPPRQMFEAVCADCGQPTQVPFQPRGDRPVYCRDCFQKRRASGY